jgi:hypothetical protein
MRVVRRIRKASKHSTRRIDLAVSALMAFDRAAQYEPPKKVNLWVRGYEPAARRTGGHAVSA